MLSIMKHYIRFPPIEKKYVLTLITIVVKFFKHVLVISIVIIINNEEDYPLMWWICLAALSNIS